MESLAALLRRAKLTDLSKFFPQNHRTDDEVVHFFKERDLSSVADWYKARKQALAKEALKSAVVHELANDEWREDESKIDDACTCWLFSGVSLIVPYRVDYLYCAGYAGGIPVASHRCHWMYLALFL